MSAEVFFDSSIMVYAMSRGDARADAARELVKRGGTISVQVLNESVAGASGKDAEQLVKDTVVRMLANQARFVAGVQRGIEQADRGELIEHKEVVSRIERLFHS